MNILGKYFPYVAVVVIIVLIVILLSKKAKAEYYVLAAKEKVVANELSLNNAELEQMANTIHSALNGLWTEDEEGVIRIMSRLNNESDYYALVSVFGRRKSDGFLIYFEGTLPEWIRRYFSSSQLKKLNNHLEIFGITI